MANVNLRSKGGGSSLAGISSSNNEDENGYERPIVINQCRKSITEYHLRALTPASRSHSGELDTISAGSESANSSGSGSPCEGRSHNELYSQQSDANNPNRDPLPSVIGTMRKLPSANSEISHPNIFIHEPEEEEDIILDDEETDAEIQNICQKDDEEALDPISEPVARPEQYETVVAANYFVEVNADVLAADSEEEIGDETAAADSVSSRSTPPATMSSPRAKSPRPVTPKKDEKDESFWDKFGTIGRKKRIKEVQAFEEEGKNAIDSPGSPTTFDIPPEEYDLAEGEERSLIERRSLADPKLQQLMSLLIDWINDELADQRIIVKSIEHDLYDGQVLQKLLDKLTGQKLEVTEVTQSEEGQRQKLQIVLASANQVLGFPRWSQSKWSVDSIHSKSVVAILYLLVHLVRHFRAPLRLPENVNVETVVVKKKNAKLEYRRVTEEITSTYDEFGMRCERDAFDALLDHAPDKLQVVKKSLITFVNKHLNKINLEVSDIDNQFHDGVYLTLLMGLLEKYFVPLFEFHLTPKDFEQKVYNVSFAFELMQDAGLSKPKARPEDIVNLDLKSTLRVLYNLFAKYKNLG